MQLVAFKPGQEFLIPVSYRAQYAGWGFSFRGASPDLEAVRFPTPLLHAKKRAAAPTSTVQKGEPSPTELVPPVDPAELDDVEFAIEHGFQRPQVDPQTGRQIRRPKSRRRG